MTQFRVRHVRPVGDDQHAQHVVAGGPEQRPFRRTERDHQRRHTAQDVGNDRQRQRAATFGHAHSPRPETEVRPRPPRGSTRQQLRSCRRPSAVGNRSRQKKTRISTLSAIDRERKWFGSGGFEMSAIVSERVPPLATPTRRPETVVVTARHVNRAVARRRRQSVSVEIPETRIASFDYRISTTDRPTDRKRKWSGKMSAMVSERSPTRAERSMRSSSAVRTRRRVMTTTFIELPTIPTTHSALPHRNKPELEGCASSFVCESGFFSGCPIICTP